MLLNPDAGAILQREGLGEIVYGIYSRALALKVGLVEGKMTMDERVYEQVKAAIIALMVVWDARYGPTSWGQ